MVKKMVGFLGLIPSVLLFFVGGYNATLTLLTQIFSDFIDFTNFSLVNLFTPYTSVGGSGTFIDSVVAGPGSSGGSAIRYWTYMVYALMTAVGYAGLKTCWATIIEKKD